MKINHNGSRIDTTVRDLIAAVTEVAFEYSVDAKEAHQLTSLVLAQILRTHAPGGDIVDRPISWH